VTVTAGGAPSGNYQLEVLEKTGKSAGPGQIVVRSPLELYYQSTNGLGLNIRSGGIVNQVTKGSGASLTNDPSKLAIYGGEVGNDYQTLFATTTPFYGVMFDPQAKVKFENTAALEWYGALNVKRIDTGTATVRVHWDEALSQAFPGTGGGVAGACSAATPCKPKAGTWSFE
jgi:hypothetical protein